MSEDFNPFENVDLSGFGDADITFTQCRFTADNLDDRGNPIPAFTTDMVNVDGETRDDQRFSVGRGYKILKGGELIEHETPRHNKTGGFGAGTKMGTLLEKCMELDADTMIRRYEETGLTPRQAAFWEGFSFHGKDETRKFKETEYKILIPTAVYGWDWDGAGVDAPAPATSASTPTPAPAPATAKKAAAKKAAAKKTPPTRRPKEEPTPAPAPDPDPATGPTNDWDLDETIFVELVALVDMHPSFDDFIEAAYELDSINVDGVSDVVDDETGFYDTVKAALAGA